MVPPGAAGIGGGGLNVPILLNLWRLALPQATVLSHVTIFGNSLGSVIANFLLLGGHRSLSLPLCLVLIPPFIAGHAIGITIFPIIPPFFVLLGLGVLLLYAAYHTAHKGMRAFREEFPVQPAGSHRPGSFSVQASRVVALREPLLAAQAAGDGAGDGGGAPAPALTLTPTPTPAKEQDQQHQEQGQGQVPVSANADADAGAGAGAGAGAEEDPGMRGLTAPRASAVLAAVWAMWLFEYFALGSKSRPSFIGGQQPLRLTPAAIAWVVVAGTAMGIAAGIVGIGGGEFLTPFLLKLGLPAVSASSTSAFAILLAVSSDVVNYIALGKLAPLRDYCICLCLMAFAIGLFGRLKVVTWVKKRKGGSVIIVALAVVLLVCAALALWGASKRTSGTDAFVFTPSKVCNSSKA
eukprot:g479.t1